ncbi:MAG: ribosomal L7Ae/L30e/S12e/Gadd45 family protein [Oscillospiraceae bacterium]
MKNNILFAMSLCRKAGALVTGFDAVKESVMSGKAELVLYANDISEGTKKRMLGFCEDMIDAIEVPLDQYTISQICKKPTGVFAVTNNELCKLCRKNLATEPCNLKEERNERIDN